MPGEKMSGKAPDHYKWFKHPDPNKWPNLEAYDREETVSGETTKTQEVSPDVDLVSPEEIELNPASTLKTDEGTYASEEPSVIVSKELSQEEMAQKAQELLSGEIPGGMSGEMPKKTPESIEDIDPTDNFNDDNKDLYSKLPTKSKKTAGRVFGILYKIPGVQQIVGRLEIAHKQSKIDKHQNVNIGLKEQLNSIGYQLESLEIAKKGLEEVSAQFEAQGIVETKSLDLKIADINKQIADFGKQKNEIQSEFEDRKRKIDRHVDERDDVADMLIEKYTETLKPMEAVLTDLQSNRDQLELTEAVLYAQHVEKVREFDKLKKTKEDYEIDLRKDGFSVIEIKENAGIKMMEEQLNNGYKKVVDEHNEILKQKSEIDAKIGNVKVKANVYYDKRDNFVRVKNNHPLKIKVETRSREGVITEDEAKKRAEQTKVDVDNRRNPVIEVVIDSSVGVSGGVEGGVKEKAVEKDSRLGVMENINNWNAFLKKKYGDNANKQVVPIASFCLKTGLIDSMKFQPRLLKDMIKKYYKYLGITVPDKISKDMDEFFVKKINS